MRVNQIVADAPAAGGVGTGQESGVDTVAACADQDRSCRRLLRARSVRRRARGARRVAEARTELREDLQHLRPRLHDAW